MFEERKHLAAFKKFMTGQSYVGSEKLEHSWALKFSDCSITAECLFRVIVDGRIAVTNNDDGQKYGLPAPVDVSHELNVLLGQSNIVLSKLSDNGRDLSLVFSNGVQLQLIAEFSGYEAWNVNYTVNGQPRIMVK